MAMGKHLHISDLEKYVGTGMYRDEVAAELGIHYDSVRRAFLSFGLEPPPYRPSKTHPPAGNSVKRIDRELIRMLDSEGKSARQISEAVGCSKRMVIRIRRELGISKRDSNPVYSDEFKAKVLKMLEDGASYREVRRTLGIGDRTVQRWFPGYGWTPAQATEYRDMLKKMEKLDTPADRRIYSNL